MQDRFKFRVWSIANKKYCHFATTDLSSDGLLRVIRPLEQSKYIDDYENRYVIQQCTGLKDKNGKLIYEKDYIKYNKKTYKIEFDKFLGISLTCILNSDIIRMNDTILSECEVISNEFECNTKI